MTLEQFLDALRRRLSLAAVVVLIGAVVTAIALTRVQATFTAYSSVLMVAETSGESSQSQPSPIKPILSSDLPMLATTPTVVDRVARDLQWPTDSVTAERITKSIKAKLATPSTMAGSGGVLTITYMGDSDDVAVRGANAVASEVTSFYRQNATERFSTLVDDLERQMALRRSALGGMDQGIEALIAAHPELATTKDGGRALDIEYQKLVADRLDSQTALRADRAAAAVTDERTAEVAATAHRDITENDPTFHNLRDQYAKDYAQLVRVRSEYSSRYPGLAELEHSAGRERAAMLSQERKLRAISPTASLWYANALDEVNKGRAAASSDAARLSGIEAALSETQARITGGQSAATTLSVLKRERDVASAEYTELATRLADAVANKAEAGSVGSVIVLDRARYSKKAGHHLLAITIGAFATLLAMVLSIILAERLDKRLRNLHIIEDIYGVPVIGSIR